MPTAHFMERKPSPKSPSPSEDADRPCPTCNGTGRLPTMTHAEAKRQAMAHPGTIVAYKPENQPGRRKG